MKVSIVIPIYHVEKYIEQCVLSVLSQDYRPLEVVFVDDCSNDKSLELARQVITEHGGEQIEFQYLRHLENKGLAAARNTGIKAATGDCLYFLDSDDELAEHAISVMVGQMRRYPQCEIVHGRMVLADGSDYHHIEEYRQMVVLDGNDNIRRRHYSQKEAFPDTACDKLIKKDFILGNNLFFKEGIIFEDSHWLDRAVKKLSAVTFVSGATYIRYINPNSIMTSLTREREIRNIGIILKDFVVSIDEPCYDEQLFTYYNKFLTYYDASKGEYGFNELYVTFRNLFFRRKFYKMGILMILYRKRFFYKEANIKARIRGYMYHNINAFFERKDCC